MNQIYFVLQQTFGFSAKKQTEGFAVPKLPGGGINASYFTALLAVMLFSCFGAFAQTNYYSKATATDFNDVNSWGTANDGTGTAPAAISDADNFFVANGAALTLSGNATVRQLTINTGSLAVSANTLTVAKAGLYDSSLTVNTGGMLILSSTGAVTVLGNVLFANGSSFTQSGGTLSVDGNNGGTQTGSVASGTPLFAVGTSATVYTTGTMSWTGGKIVIVDPHAATTNTHAVYIGLGAVSGTNVNINAGLGHTFQIGDGASTDAGGNAANGFYVDMWVTTGALKTGNYVINTSGGTNRHVTQNYKLIVGGNLTVTSGELRFAAGPWLVAGNIFVDTNGIFTNTGTLIFSDGNYTSGTATTNFAVTAPQTVGGPGVFRNLTASPTANFTSLTINNTSAGGVTFSGTSNIAAQPANSMSVSGTLTFTAGKVFTATGASMVLGTAPGSAGTLAVTAGGFGSGATFGRWVAAANALATITAGTDNTAVAGRWPFVNAGGDNRSAFIERTGAAAAGGVIGITYVNSAGTSPVSLTEDSYVADIAGNDTWAVSQMMSNPITNTTSFELQLQGPGMFGGSLATASARVVQGTDFVGTHQAGTVIPGAQRAGLTPAEIVAGPFRIVAVSADAPVTSVASGSWDNPATWSTGAVPTCTQNVAIMAGHTVTVNSTFNEAKNITINALGILTVASGDLTVECSLSNGSIVNNGTLTIAGGTLNVNGYINNTASSSFAQLGGTIIIDGNNGVVAESVPSGTPLFNMLSTNVNLSAGTLMFVDPHIATTNTSGYTINLNNGTPSVTTLAASPSHNTIFGDGFSTDSGGSTSGFYINNWAGSAYLSLGSMTVNGNGGTNRNVATVYQLTANGDVTVAANSTLTAANLIIGGNLTVDGTFVNTTATTTAVVTSNTSSALTFGAITNAQTFTNNGTIANLAASPTANFAALTVNNTSAAGLTLASPFRVSATLTLTAGKVNTDVDNMLTLGTTTAAGTLAGGSATAYINGPFERTIANNNANTNYILFPVGKTAYAPIWLAPATTSVAVMQAEAFDSNTGTPSSAIMDLASGRRWEAPLISGTVTSVNVRLGGTFVADNIPVMAGSAAGEYTSAFGSTSTFVAGPPTTIQSTTPAAAGDYTGFISYAKSNLCSGTPAPGNTIASSASICRGASVTLSAENATIGSGISYQWQSSTDGVDFSDIDGATASTLTVTPTVATHYQLKVTCSAGPSTGTSTSVHVQFTNNIIASSGATRCGTGTVNLGATGTPGSTVSWYAAQTGGTAIATGETYSPTVTANTTFYAEATTQGTELAGGKLAPETGWTGSTLTDWGIVFTALQSTNLNSVDIYSTANGTVNVKITNATGTELYATGNIAVTAGGTTTPTTIPLNFAITAGSTYKVLVKSYTGVSLVRGGTNLAFPYTNADISVTASEWGGTTTSTYYYFYNFKTMSSCASPRVAVTATVNTPPALTLSTNTVAICNGASSAPVTVTAGNTDYDNYIWTPSAGVSGNATTGWIFNPAVSGTYTLSASQTAEDLCTASATVTVTVNPVPSALAITNSGSTSTCIGTVQSLSVSGGLTPGTVNIGAATTTTTGTEELTAFNNRRITYKMQSIYTAAELTAAGLRPGPITSLAFNIATLGDGVNVTAYTLKLGSTANDAFAGTTYISDTGFTTVFGPATYTHAVGVNTINFTTPYVWDGTSNIVINVTHGGANSTNNAQTYYSTTTGNTTLYNYNSAANVASNKRFNVVFGGMTANNVTWSPVTDLYTDATATTAYVAGSNASMVYVKPAASGSVVYTATAGTTCPVTATITISAVDCAIGWGNLQWPASATINTCGTETVYGKVWKSGITETAGAHPNMKVWAGVSTTNTDPATWTEAQWNTASYQGQSDNDDEYKYAITGLAAGTYYYAYRYQYLDGTYWYGGFNSGGGGAWNGTSNVNGMLTVNAIALPTAADQTVCQGTTFAGLTATGTGLKWYSVSTNGTAIPDTDVVAAGTYYVSQTIDGCESARVTVAVTISTFDAPVPTVTQPTCTVATGTITVTSLGTGYTYSINGTDFQSELEFANVAAGNYTLTAKNSIGCTKTASVTVNAQPTAPVVTDITDQVVCTGYTLPAITVGNYYTQTNGGGTMLAAGDVISSNQTIYIFAESAGCSDEESFSVTITGAPAQPTGAATQTITVSNAADATIEDLVATAATGTISWYTSEANALAGIDALLAGTQLVSGETYYATASNGTCYSATALAVTVDVALGRDDFSFTNLKYYPNPVTDKLTISHSSAITSVEVYNLLGQLVISERPGTATAEVNMGQLQEATYIVRISSEGKSKDFKIVKK